MSLTQNHKIRQVSAFVTPTKFNSSNFLVRKIFQMKSMRRVFGFFSNLFSNIVVKSNPEVSIEFFEYDVNFSWTRKFFLLNMSYFWESSTDF